MSPKRYYTFMIDPELADRLKAVKETDGMPEGEQIRRALRAWFEKRDRARQTAKRRAGTRRKA